MRVIVIGGGPGGAFAATLLSRHGVAVTLVEQSRFPRDKVCGECLSALGLRTLKHHGLDANICSEGRRLTRATLYAGNASATLPLPSPMLGLSRFRLDRLLIDAAVAAGAELRQPARAEAVEPTLYGVRVRVRCLVTNAVEQLPADWLVVADGRGALLANRPPATHDLGIKTHFRRVEADPNAISLFGGSGSYGGLAAIEDGRWNAAFTVPREAIAAVRGDIRRYWTGLLDRMPVLKRKMRHAEQTTEWLAAPLPRHGVGRNWPDRIVPIGAAACAIEPIGGEGMGTVLRSAELAAEALIGEEVDRLPHAYRALWRRRSLFCRIGGMLLAGRSAADAVSLARLPLVADLAMRAVGK